MCLIRDKFTRISNDKRNKDLGLIGASNTSYLKMTFNPLQAMCSGRGVLLENPSIVTSMAGYLPSDCHIVPVGDRILPSFISILLRPDFPYTHSIDVRLVYLCTCNFESCIYYLLSPSIGRRDLSTTATERRTGHLTQPHFTSRRNVSRPCINSSRLLDSSLNTIRISLFLCSISPVSSSGRAGRLRLMGKYIDHRLVARPELDISFWTDSSMAPFPRRTSKVPVASFWLPFSWMFKHCSPAVLRHYGLHATEMVWCVTAGSGKQRRFRIHHNQFRHWAGRQ